MLLSQNRFILSPLMDNRKHDLLMSDVTEQLQAFINNIKETQTIWALQDPKSDEWVVCDSAVFDETEVMPLWTSKALAQDYCVDEWADYRAQTISVDDFLEFWVSDLNYDGVTVGLDWQGNDEDNIEFDPIDVAKALAEYEAQSFS